MTQLHIVDLRKQHACIADDRATRIEDDLLAALAEGRQRAADECGDRLRRLVLIANADAAADIDVPQADARRMEAVHELA